MTEPDSWLTEELLIVRHSGEIPEIAFHSSLYYLCEDPDGPQLTLGQNELDLLRQQVVARYREILLRDLSPENRDARIFRGLKRCIFNWERLGKFCTRQEMEIEAPLRLALLPATGGERGPGRIAAILPQLHQGGIGRFCQGDRGGAGRAAGRAWDAVLFAGVGIANNGPSTGLRANGCLNRGKKSARAEPVEAPVRAKG